MPLHGKNIIGNRLSAEGKRTRHAVNPATGERLATAFHDATTGEVDRALTLADRAFRHRRPRNPQQDADLLKRIADEMEALGDELIDRTGAETGLPEGRLKMERGRTCYQLRLFAEVVAEGSWVDARIDRAIAERKPIPKPDVRRMLIPIGPVVVFPASNFPLAFSVAGGDTASALAAGCPVIVKARPAHPGASDLVGQAVQKACLETGMPDGWFSMLHGTGRETGMALVRHPIVRAVGFTGSLSGGRTLFDAAAARPDPIPVYAEMGSINPVFLLPGALAERAEQIAEGLHQSVTLGVGQFCTNPGLVVAVADESLDRFLAATGRLIEETAPGTMLLEGILAGYRQGVERLSKVSGVRVAAQCRRAADLKKTQAAAALFVAEGDAFLENSELGHEVFGPATLVIRCRDRQQMLQVARNLEGQLTATIHAAEDELAAQGELIAILESKAGRVVLNGFPTGVEVCPSMNHGGPYPATTDVRTTSVGTAAILRFARPACYQGFRDDQLPQELQDRNVRGIWRLVDGVLSKDDVL
ncbi:MAG: aldehyde dehydrogenase (NADP(+)) [Pirellulales bacterium]|nr:aldehyde dehydrogenase (NADP(+)) [Pirellulales bacterium]